MKRYWFIAWVCVLVALFPIACERDDGGSDSGEEVAEADDDDDDSYGPGTEPGDSAGLDGLIDALGFDDYLNIRPVRAEPGVNNYTNYYYSTGDVRCFDGGEAHVSVSYGTENRVMLFLEGGGARWPGGGFAVDLDYPFDISFKSRDEANPLRNWHFVYVPYCDASIHSGDREFEYDGEMRYHDGLRHTTAAVALMKALFPDAEKVLVAGSSAGGFGTYYAWLVAKSQYREASTYILNDSGVGFWNPADLATWELIKQTWDLRLTDECRRCGELLQTYVYGLFQDYDPQVRIGMFSSYRDFIITGWFLDMDPEAFQYTLLAVTDDLRADHPNRFARFFVDGNSHTSYEFLFPEGPNYRISGVSMYEWIAGLVGDDPAWPDLLE